MSSFDFGFLLADGKRLAVGWPSSGVLVAQNYDVTSVSLDLPVSYSFPHSSRVFFCESQPTLSITIESKGPFLQTTLEEGAKLLKNADAMSVNELLDLAYQKMQNRNEP